MKIKEKGQLTTGEALAELIGRKGQGARATGTGAQSVGRDGVDQVNVERGKALNEALSPEELQKARQAKIDELKARILSGNYSPPSESVGSAMAAQLHEFVSLFGGKSNSGNDDDEEFSAEG